MKGLAVLILLAGFASGADADKVFAEKIQPILASNCAGCHTGAKAQAGFSVASLDDLLKGGKRGAALQPGSAAKSLLMQFVRGEQSPQMPIGGKPLAADTVNALAAAIDSLKPVAESAVADAHTKWVYTTPVAPAIPSVKTADWVRNPIDAFVLSKLEAKGWAPAPAASKRALMRRVFFDLVGLPPTVEESNAFLKDESPDAYEKLIDRLLADKRYGERWGRHWLDLVRFAESDGFAIDGERPTAWRYRDYVIRAFNEDKPYDVFVKEQIAGDELERRGGRGEANEGLLALGYLRMGPWEQDANFDDQLRLDWLNEVTGTTSQVFMGLTVGCARCHDHKYDPIPQRDFYRMQAFFAATRIDDRPAPHLESEDRLKMRGLLRKYEDNIEALSEQVKTMEAALRKKFDANAKPDQKFQEVLGDKENALFSKEERKAHNDLQEQQRRLNIEMMRYRPTAFAVNEVAPPAILEVAPTYVLAGGELVAKGDKVEPGFLRSVVQKEEPAKVEFAGRYRSGRRLTLANWMASPSHPLTARVMMNRIWQHHFGEGIVRTPSDFGKNGERPTHPELLDWLSTQFIEKGWKTKAMHKLLLTSNTYRQATSHPEALKYAEADSQNQFLWRMNWIRLESEVIRDSMLALSGRLNPQAGGPGMFFGVSDEVAQGFQMFKWYPSDEEQQRRRSVYAFQRRSLMMPMMEVFDGANMSESCSRRSVTTVAPQALTLLNGTLTNTESKHFAQRVVEIAGANPDAQIDKAFSLMLARDATDGEKEKVRQLYAGRKPVDAVARLATVLFNANEFLYLE